MNDTNGSQSTHIAKTTDFKKVYLEKQTESYQKVHQHGTRHLLLDSNSRAWGPLYATMRYKSLIPTQVSSPFNNVNEQSYYRAAS